VVVVVVGGGAVVVVGGGAVVVVVGGGGAVVVVAGTVVVVAGGRVGVVCGCVVVVVDELLVVVVVGLLELDDVMSTMINTIKMTARAAINHGHQLRFCSPSSSWPPPGGRVPGGWYAPAAVGTTVVASPGPVTALVGWSAADGPWTLVGWSAADGP
jgi:hypothetical protein